MCEKRHIAIGQFVAGSEKVYFPAFFNAHVHLGENVFADISGDDWTLERYLDHTRAHNDRASASAREAEWRRSARDVLQALTENWTVGFCAGRGSEAYGSEAFALMAGYPIMKGTKLNRYLKMGEAGFRAYRAKYADERCSVGVFFHSLYVNGDDECLSLAKKCLDCGGEFLTAHVAEDGASARQEMRAWGCSAVAALDRRGLLSDRSLLVHCGFCDDWDLDRIAERRASVALCPISSEFLNTRMPDVRKLDERGIPWMLCSDGTATGRTVSLIDQALTLKQHQPWVEYADIFEAMTVRPARFYGKAYYTGRIDGVSRAKCLCAKWRGAVGAGFLDALFGKRLEISYSDAPEVP